MTKKFSENLPLLSVILIYFGYCNLYYYYKEFNVDIYNYISNSEILLSFLPIVVIVTATIGTVFISYIIGSATRQNTVAENLKENSELNEGKIKKNKNKFLSFLFSPIIICVLFTFLELFITYLLKTHYHYKDYELRIYYLYTSILTPIVYYFVLTKIGGKEVFSKYSFLIAISIIIFVGSQIGYFKKREADELKKGVGTHNISFKYDTNIIKTTNVLILIGQTQSAMFLYNKLDSSTLVFKREKIDSLKIK